MSLTEEQIKNLKPGDIVNIWGLVNLPLCDGNILVELRYEFDNRILPAYKKISTEFISMPCEPEGKPKYDPCRKFKKGDKVNVTPRDGRYPVVLPMNYHWVGKNAMVIEDEDDDGFVQVCSEAGYKMRVAFFFLEMVYTVEERMPYSVQDTMNHDGWQIVRDGLPLALYDVQRHPDAKAAAEAECKRLNTEWLKEHENDYFQNGK